MKTILSLVMLLLITCAAQAQRDITTFLGIPVDGYLNEMRENLMNKGFAPVPGEEFLVGEYNGEDVHVYIDTYNNKVYRIALVDVDSQDPEGIKSRFNKLVQQFDNNDRYVGDKERQDIPEHEDIVVGMRDKEETYQAEFYQIPDVEMLEGLLEHVAQECIKQLSERGYGEPSEEELHNAIKESMEEIALEIMKKKSVWFRIMSDKPGEFYIAMYYDNEFNKSSEANGEEL